jgi:hypothetical protein
MRTAGAFLGGAAVGIVLVAAAAALISFPAKNPKKALDCVDDINAKACTVKVDVESCGLLGLQHCVSVPDDAVVIHDRKKIDVYWTIVNTNYKFAANGIVVTNGDNELGDCKPDGDFTFFCKNKHTKFGVYKYTIYVVGLDPLDPWVIND